MSNVNERPALDAMYPKEVPTDKLRNTGDFDDKLYVGPGSSGYVGEQK